MRADSGLSQPEPEDRATRVPRSGLPRPRSRFFCSRLRSFNLLVWDGALQVEEDVCFESSAHEAS